MTQQQFFTRYTYSPRTDKLGGGAFGTVYKAYDNTNNVFIALKVAEVKTINGKEFSLKDEFEAIKGLPAHPNIANYDKVYTFEQPNGIFDYALIQYYKDGNLSDLMQSQNLSFQEGEDLAIQILEGLSFLHSHSVVHRDLKPSNILIHRHDITGRYIAKIADFGLSKKFDNSGKSRMTNSFGGGTLKYSSPEQLKGETIKANTDLWAWAVMTIELITGKYPFDVPDVNTGSYQYEQKLYENILKNNLQADILQLPQKWQNAINRCLQKDIDERCNDISELFQILEIPQERKDVKAEETKVLEGTKTEIVEIPNPVKEEKPKVVVPQNTPQKKKNFVWLWVLFFVAAGCGAVYYMYSNGFFDKKEVVQKINVDEARTIYKKLHQIQISDEIDRLSEVYTDPLEKYFTKDNPSLQYVIAEAKNYASKWKENKMEILSFEEISPNRFKYHISYSVRKLETGKIFDYDVWGELHFVKTDSGYKINYITDINTDKNIQDFTYKTSALKTSGQKNGYTLTFESEILMFPDISNDLILDYLYKDVIGGSGFSGWSASDFYNAQKNQFQSELGDLYNLDSPEDMESYMTQYESKTKMTLKNADQNFLSVEVFHYSYSGGAHGLEGQLYRNVDYKNNNVVSLSSIINIQNVPWNTLLRRCLTNYSKDYEGNNYDESVLFEPDNLTYTENIWFDNQNLYLVYQPYEIASYADGIITIKVPFSEIDEWIKQDFKTKIEESKKINIKKL